MLLMGIGDEAASSIEGQIQATHKLSWRHIEMRGVEVAGHPKSNIHDLPNAAFDVAAGRLMETGIHVHCFGSAIMNWAKRIEDPFSMTLDEVKRSIPRMQQLGTRFVRVMSFKPDAEEHRIPTQVFQRLRDVTNMFLDAGLQPVHENCMNYGGMSWKHALELLDQVPGLKWVFDMGNPVFNPDRSKPKPWPRQDAWEFWENVREHVVHIHVKDAVWNPHRKDADYHWPGEGHGRVREILTDALRRGYTGGVSIEPHMVVVFHDVGAVTDQAPMMKNFVDYGRRLEKLIAEAKADAEQPGSRS